MTELVYGGMGWRRIIWACGLGTLFLLVRSPAAQAQYIYTTNSPDTNTVTITKYTGSGGTVALPSNILGKTVTDIGDGAFEGAVGLTGVTIPNSVISIGDYAFGACSNLMSFAIGSGVASIGEDAFYWCTSLTWITVASANTAYSSKNGVLYDKSQRTLLQCPGGKTGSYTIPDNVYTIGSLAFSDCIRLTNVVFGLNVESIRDYAFWGCTSLTKLLMGDRIIILGQEVFTSCTNLTAIYFPGGAPSFTVMPPSLGAAQAKVYHLPGTAGWPSVPDAWAGCPTALWSLEPFFDNLDFELAMVPDVEWGGYVPISEGLPAWNGSHSSILHNNATLGDSALAIIGPWGWSQSVINGQYSALLIGGANSSAWIEQTALVPEGTRSIILCERSSGSSGFGVWMDGAFIPMFPLQISSTVTWWEGDITPFGGLVSKLTIMAYAGGPLGVNPVTIDDIEFSTQPIDERLIRLSGNLAFGNVVTGQTKTAILTITNSGNTALSVTGIGYPSGFSGAWSGSIAAGRSTNVTVTFAPLLVQAYGGTATVTSDATSGTGTIGVSGTGIGGHPQAQAGENFGVLSNRFGFSINWASGQVVVVDGCTNLINPVWSPLQTNVLSNTPTYFSDPKWTNLMGRFYRIRAP